MEWLLSPVNMTNGEALIIMILMSITLIVHFVWIWRDQP